jgi:hypothetical protein
VCFESLPGVLIISARITHFGLISGLIILSRCRNHCYGRFAVQGRGTRLSYVESGLHFTLVVDVAIDRKQAVCASRSLAVSALPLRSFEIGTAYPARIDPTPRIEVERTTASARRFLLCTCCVFSHLVSLPLRCWRIQLVAFWLENISSRSREIVIPCRFGLPFGLHCYVNVHSCLNTFHSQALLCLSS